MDSKEMIDRQIAAFPDWRGEILRSLREVINSADPDIKEEWKWSTAVWTKSGLICAISAFKNHVKINFFQGAHLRDMHGLINAGFDSKDHRAIDFYEGELVDESKVRDLVQEAINFNQQARK
jgi:hypothetical protein